MEHKTVESYNEFLNLMETSDYNDQIILNDGGRKYSNSYPPTFMNIELKDFKSSLSDSESKRTRLFPDIRISNQREIENKDVTGLFKEICPNELPGQVPELQAEAKLPELQDLDPQDHLKDLQLTDLQLTDLALDYQDYVPFGALDYDNVSIISYESDDDNDNDNAMVPGLFPKLDINKDFLKFDKLPLNPSYIAH